MGIYLNPNSANFEETLKRPIFVDKTMILKTLNRFIDQQNKYICVSRPRRFGKTIASNIISSYYSKGSNSREIFSKLKFGQDEDFESKLNKFNFIKIDLNSEYRNSDDRPNVLKNLKLKLKREISEAFPEIKFEDYESFTDRMLKVFTQTGDQFFILIDEYDVFVREQVNGVISDELFTEYLDFLNGLFKSDTLKPAIALAYLT
ncbi:MAG: AAA family ATPase, partial [Treponema sp.]|nr:AAA family ATPase [Treponema sp.]